MPLKVERIDRQLGQRRQIVEALGDERFRRGTRFRRGAAIRHRAGLGHRAGIRSGTGLDRRARCRSNLGFGGSAGVGRLGSVGVAGVDDDRPGPVLDHRLRHFFHRGGIAAEIVLIRDFQRLWIALRRGGDRRAGRRQAGRDIVAGDGHLPRGLLFAGIFAGKLCRRGDQKADRGDAADQPHARPPTWHPTSIRCKLHARSS